LFSKDAKIVFFLLSIPQKKILKNKYYKVWFP